jgi:hypothetical protein
MEALMLLHLANFIATEHNKKKQMEKGVFLNESILGQVQLGSRVKFN